MSAREYAVEWCWDAHTLGGYGEPGDTPAEAFDNWKKPLLDGDCIVSREVGTEKWEFREKDQLPYEGRYYARKAREEARDES
jgi:hypothetical protein